MATETLSRISREAENFSLQEIEELQGILLARRAKLLLGEDSAEPRLLAAIDAAALPRAKRLRLEELSQMSFAETLPEELRPELIALCDESTNADARRLELVAQLAALRGVPARQLVEELKLFEAP